MKLMIGNSTKFVEDVINVVTKQFHVSFIDIIRQTRKKQIAEARQVIAYCLRLLKGMSFPAIGEILGGRDHTTIMHACSKIARMIEVDNDFKIRIEITLKSIRELDSDSRQEKSEFVDEQSVIDGKIADSLFVENENHDSLIELGFDESIYEVPKQNLELSDREVQILENYRLGKTLQEIAKKLGVSRERIRQIALKSMLKEVGSKIKAGFEIDVNEYIKGEKITHELARFSMPEEEKTKFLEEFIAKAANYNSVSSFARDVGIQPIKIVRIFPEVVEVIENNIREKKSRWSRFYVQCRGCNTKTIPHARMGYCQRCTYGRSAESRESILGQNTVCVVCSIDRSSAIRKFGKDLFIAKDGRIFCRGCFLQFTGTKLAESRWG